MEFDNDHILINFKWERGQYYIGEIYWQTGMDYVSMDVYNDDPNA